MRKTLLVALGLACVVPLVFAAACSTSRSKPATVSVSPGADDWGTLSDALSLVKDGGTIKLAAGTYRLSQPLQIVKSVNIVGSGQTILQCEFGDYVVAFGSGYTCAVDNVAFVHAGDGVGDAVYDSGSRVAFTQCRFVGGASGGRKGGMGLSFGEGAGGSVTDCLVTGNESLGIYVGSNADVTVKGCTIKRNGTGIGVMNGSLVATANTVTGNKLGIYVIGHSKAQLIGNTCSHDRLGGIRVEGTSTVTARANKCFADTMSGMLITGSARATLVNNSTKGSLEGITFAGRSSGSAVRNHCADRIYVTKGLHVRLVHNWQPAFSIPGLGSVRFD